MTRSETRVHGFNSVLFFLEFPIDIFISTKRSLVLPHMPNGW